MSTKRKYAIVDVLAFLEDVEIATGKLRVNRVAPRSEYYDPINDTWIVTYLDHTPGISQSWKVIVEELP